MRKAFAALTLAFVPALAAGAQTVSYPPADRQIAAAVSPLPQPLQKGARVLGYDSQGKLTTLRAGTNDMICVADDPSGERFHVACYHKSLEPFMARGRELHALKKSREAVDSVRMRDIKTGRYAMPSKPAALYQYFAARDSVDAATGTVKGAQYLYVVYMPYASEKTTGITENPLPGGPWIMYPGKPWAHIMISPQKTAPVAVK
ncbi:MAG TPA: hypothetical protein VHM24_11555 [Gemmatimonadaceae bacterium]|nr:hypothetical protein [Gemmatimonadaceae bacterium]